MNQSGYVYVLDNLMGHYKIGKAKEIHRRISRLRIQLPFPVEVLHCVHVADKDYAEKLLHISYKHKRINGEWFALDEEEVAWLLRDMDELGVNRSKLEEGKDARLEEIKYSLGIAEFTDLLADEEMEKDYIEEYIGGLWAKERANVA